MNELESSLEKYLHGHIPLSGAMGVTVASATQEKIVLNASFAQNINHKQTVFGGSLHAVATLACWSLLHVNLSHLKNTQLVISHSEVDYLAPVSTDFKAECYLPDSEEWDRFLNALQKKGKARLNLQAHIIQEGRLCVDYLGTFVALAIT